jgi:hypothetical protein
MLFQNKPIAFQCWADGGPSVERARDLLTFHRAGLNDSTLGAYNFPDDDCMPGIAYRFEDASTPPELRN